MLQSKPHLTPSPTPWGSPSAYAAAAPTPSIYVSNPDFGTVSKIDAGGSVSTFSAGLDTPTGLAFDPSGTLYGLQWGFQQGAGSLGTFNGGGAFSTLASGLDHSFGMAINSSGEIFFGVGNNLVKYSSAGTLLASYNMGGGTTAVALDAAGNVFASSLGTVYQLPTDLSSASVFATGGSLSSSVTGLAFDSMGNLYVDDYIAGKVERFTPGGSDLGVYISGLNTPWGLAFDSSDTLYVANYGAGQVLKAAPGGGEFTVFASGLSGPVFLAVEPVPEASTWAAAGFVTAIGGLTAWRRMKRPNAA